MTILLPQWLEKLLGVVLLDDAIITECVERAKKRCANVDVFLHSRDSAEVALAIAAREAVCAVFQDHYPAARKANLVRENWPKARVMLLGARATIQIWIGLDYEDVDGIEPFDITVVRAPNSMGVVEKIQHRLSRTRRPLVLEEVAPAAFVAAKSSPPSLPSAPTPQPAQAANVQLFTPRSSRMMGMVASEPPRKVRK